MRKQLSAEEELRIRAKADGYSDNEALNLVLRFGYWKKPLAAWDEKIVADVREDLKTALRRVPFSRRYDVFTLINDFLCKSCSEKGYQKLVWEDMHDKTEIQIEILKLTQGGTDPGPNRRTKEELADILHKSRKGIHPYLIELQDGTNVLGSEVQISLANKSNVYDSTIHPVFMALNLSEVNFLVNQLRFHFKGTEYERMVTEISADVYRQLSGYAQQRMRAVARNNGRDPEMDYYWQHPRSGYRKEMDQQEIPYLAKCGCCSISKKEAPDDKKFGHVIYEDGRFIFVCKDRTKIVLDEHVLGEYDIKQCDGNLVT